MTFNLLYPKPLKTKEKHIHKPKKGEHLTKKKKFF